MDNGVYVKLNDFRLSLNQETTVKNAITKQNKISQVPIRKGMVTC